VIHRGSSEWDACWTQLEAGFSELVQKLRGYYPELAWNTERLESNVPVFAAFLYLAPTHDRGSDPDALLQWAVRRRADRLEVSYEIENDHAGIVADAEFGPLSKNDGSEVGRAVDAGMRFFQENLTTIVSELRR
jgi:hypothetical protein